MKNLNVYIIGVSLLSSLFSGCQDETVEKGYGYLQVSSVQLDKTIIPQTKADVQEPMALEILKDGEVIKATDDWTTLQQTSLLLPVGTYVLKAYSSEKDSTGQGFDIQPYYLGEKEVTVEKGIAKPVEVLCPMVQAKVSISYTEEFKAAFSDYSCVVSNSFGHVLFAKEEARSGYFRSGQPLTAALNLTNTDNQTYVYSKTIVAKALPRYLYKVKYDITHEGTGDFTITVDQTTHEYAVEITVPLTSDADPALTLGTPNAWGQFAYLYANSALNSSEPVVFQYRKVGTEDAWTSVNGIGQSGTAYMAKTGKLEFGASYSYRILQGEKHSGTDVFKTESFQEIPNLNFDTWIQSGKNWYANPVANNLDDSQAYWATGNEGVTSFLAGSKDPITVRVEGVDAYKNYAAKMNTITGITLVGTAAGNLFIGKYKTNMSNPASSVSFGRPYTGARPVSLSGWYKYTSKPIDNGGTKPGTLTTDECNIYIRLWDASDNEIGFGEFVGSATVSTYTQFHIDVEYTDKVAKPAKIAIVATSSRYGGEFNGSKVVGQAGTGSTLWIDEFELTYYE